MRSFGYLHFNSNRENGEKISVGFIRVCGREVYIGAGSSEGDGEMGSLVRTLCREDLRPQVLFCLGRDGAGRAMFHSNPGRWGLQNSVQRAGVSNLRGVGFDLF